MNLRGRKRPLADHSTDLLENPSQEVKLEKELGDASVVPEKPSSAPSTRSKTAMKVAAVDALMSISKSANTDQNVTDANAQAAVASVAKELPDRDNSSKSLNAPLQKYKPPSTITSSVASKLPQETSKEKGLDGRVKKQQTAPQTAQETKKSAPVLSDEAHSNSSSGESTSNGESSDEEEEEEENDGEIGRAVVSVIGVSGSSAQKDESANSSSSQAESQSESGSGEDDSSSSSTSSGEESEEESDEFDDDASGQQHEPPPSSLRVRTGFHSALSSLVTEPSF